jgi:hypothetical protein
MTTINEKTLQILVTVLNKLWCGLQTIVLRTSRKAAHNSTYKKLAVLWLIEVLCFVVSSVRADSFVLQNRQLLVAAKRYRQFRFTEQFK